ncbi:MAG: hypothetical protein IID54_05240, partial [Proteobacteria bacterium]|nr:hypothetical protein [Pseudomonadota bacterium]
MMDSPQHSLAPNGGEETIRAYVRQANIVQVLAVLFSTAAIFGCLDYRILRLDFFPFIEFNHMYYFILFGFLFWVDREPPLPRRILAWAIAIAVTFAYAYHLRHLTDHYTARRVLGDTARFPAIYLWAVAVWFAAPILADWKAERYSRPFLLAA